MKYIDSFCIESENVIVYIDMVLVVLGSPFTLTCRLGFAPAVFVHSLPFCVHEKPIFPHQHLSLSLSLSLWPHARFCFQD